MAESGSPYSLFATRYPPMSSRTISIEAAHDLVIAALTASRTSAENARSVAAALVGAEADGIKSHGLSRVPSYAGQALSGKVDGFAKPHISTPAAAALVIDARLGFAYPAIDIAIARLPPLCRSHGIAAAAINRSNHCGVAGLHVERLARSGLAALMFANTPPGIAPWGARRGLFGTNPIAFAAPARGRDPIVIDLSLSKIPRGRLLLAKQKAERIPEGWALDRDGHPTTDPEAAIQGTMVPMGDAKGTALALMVEILAGGLTGARFAYESSSFFDTDGPAPETGQLIIALSPEALGGSDVTDRLADLAATIEAEPGARLAGARRLQHRGAAAAHGLDVPPALLEEIERLAQRL
jgi:(2R)-3-sulfolactate dehydrogenase (NADP+)